MDRTKPVASLSLDLDNLWSYMKTHGDSGWTSFPSYLDTVVPRSLEFFASRGLEITYFIVGQDAALEKNSEALSAIPRDGHEIGNHSFRHEPWLNLYTEAEVDDELARAEDAIEAVTGVRPDGFRGPGFSLSPTVLRTLQRRNYSFDASTFPTFLGPLARAFYFWSARLSDEDREKRKLLFGRFRDGLRPLRPYRWRLDDGDLIEMPVTTLPVFRVPFHVSYLHYLACYSPFAARQYFRAALRLCRVAGVQPSLLLHPLDFLGSDDVRELAFFPGMGQKAEVKMRWLDGFMTDFCRHFTVLPVGRHCERVAAARRLPLVELDFGSAFPDGAKAVNAPT